MAIVLDLTTLDLPVGTHTITVKAKGSKLITSAPSETLSYEVESHLISFTIDDVLYYAEEGMTWEEWVQSDYSENKFGISVTIYGLIRNYERDDLYCVYNTQNNVLVGIEGSDVNSYETNILPNGIYATKYISTGVSP